jgi:hypothetical protein
VDSVTRLRFLQGRVIQAFLVGLLVPLLGAGALSLLRVHDGQLFFLVYAAVGIYRGFTLAERLKAAGPPCDSVSARFRAAGLGYLLSMLIVAVSLFF